MARILLVLMMMLPLLCTAEIYQWTDDSGRTHFGDKPKDKEKAEQVSVRSMYTRASTIPALLLLKA